MRHALSADLPMTAKAVMIPKRRCNKGDLRMQKQPYFLLLENNPTWCTEWTRVLEKCSLEYRILPSMAAVCEHLPERPWCILLCRSEHLLTRDGTPLLDSLRLQARGLGIILYGEEARTEDLKRLMPKGLCGYLTRPFSASALQVALHHAAQRKKHDSHREDAKLWPAAARPAARSADSSANLLHSFLQADTLLDDIAALEEVQGELLHAHREIIERFSALGSYRAGTLTENFRRTSRYAGWIAQAFDLKGETCELIRHASPLHDLGTIGLAPWLPNKDAKLTRAEHEMLKKHPQIGHAILSSSDSEVLRMAASIALTHHEKFDGSGYPHRLKGEDIPIEGRIVALADSFSRLTCQAGKPGLNVDGALNTMRSLRGCAFDPHLLDALCDQRQRLLDDAKLHAHRHADRKLTASEAV